MGLSRAGEGLPEQRGGVADAQGSGGACGAGCWGTAAYLDDTACEQMVLEASFRDGLWGIVAPIHTFFHGLFLPSLGSVLPLPPWSQGLPELPWKS